MFDLIEELKNYSLAVDVVDPWASHEEVLKEYNVKLLDNPSGKYDAIIIAVGHEVYKKMNVQDLKNISKDEVVLTDIKGIMMSKGIDHYWKM